MKYNPTIHHRRSIRLKGYDYSQEGLYFVTICCQNKIYRFGHVKNGEMILNDFGKTAFDEWIQLSERYHNVVLDVFYIMPNHIHGIVALCNAATNVGATLAVAQNAVAQNVVAQNAVAQNMNNGAGVSYSGAGASPAPTATHTPTVGNIVGSYKSLVANKCLEIYKSRNKYMGKLWQRNYYEHIIRNDYAYHHIANYIINNPANWIDDRFYME